MAQKLPTLHAKPKIQLPGNDCSIEKFYPFMWPFCKSYMKLFDGQREPRARPSSRLARHIPPLRAPPSSPLFLPFFNSNSGTRMHIQTDNMTGSIDKNKVSEKVERQIALQRKVLTRDLRTKIMKTRESGRPTLKHRFRLVFNCSFKLIFAPHIQLS